ncbi:MAG: hypothetical protein LIO94_09635 [Clostridiales bacterium]|nr:hypothetical protein [Clostridiales bacterium]MCC8114063.1 hypothetical protein [Bacteroidales bacterium]
MKALDKIKEYGIGRALRRADSKYGIGRLERLFASNWLNPLATLWLNFRTLPFSQAIKLPIFVYGRPRFYCTSGRIRFECKVKPGLVTFNRSHPGSPSVGSVQSELIHTGLIIFRGKGQIDTGVRLKVDSNAVLEIGYGFKICDMVIIGCNRHIKMGNQVRIVHRCQIFDTNYHFIANLAKGVIPPRDREVTIGNNVCVFNNTTINAGARIPDDIVITSNSLVNKDYSSVPPGTVLAGVPARPVATDNFRVYNLALERELVKYYASTSEPYRIADHDVDLSILSSD